MQRLDRAKQSDWEERDFKSETARQTCPVQIIGSKVKIVQVVQNDPPGYRRIDTTIRSHDEGTKNELKKVDHKGHKDHIGREARKIKFLRPLPTLRLNHPNGTAIAVP
jgi:hypothetical protein